MRDGLRGKLNYCLSYLCKHVESNMNDAIDMKMRSMETKSQVISASDASILSVRFQMCFQTPCLRESRIVNESIALQSQAHMK